MIVKYWNRLCGMANDRLLKKASWRMLTGVATEIILVPITTNHFVTFRIYYTS
jgi:hypothetical protein